ncbi:MAG: AAA family ATPase, partial [Chryseobacterium sp.]|nr:AAA family ATPase [Chryseobacterium sp.]
AKLSHRYITDRQLPDKAIDLIDEASAKLRMEINSKPEELDVLDRKLMQMEIELAAISREGHQTKIDHLKEDISKISEQRNEINAKWLKEKQKSEDLTQIKKDIESLKLEAERASRAGDYAKVAEIQYGKIKEKEDALQKLELEMQNHQNELIKEEVTSENISEVIAKWTGIPVTKLLQSEREKLLHLETELHHRVVGQEEAIEAVANAIRRNRAGLSDEKKPIGSFLFLGTTGVGKTELAKALAEYLFDDENNMTRIDMSEYQERHSVSRLVGAPPGYVGYDEGGQLTEAVRRRPYSVVLLDEIEKAHPDVFNTLLQVLDDGRLTDNKGRVVNFKNSIIIMTSNLGSHIIQENFENITEENQDEIVDKTKIEVFDLLKQTLRPEFLNRIDETVLFQPLRRKEIGKIVQYQLRGFNDMLAKRNIIMTATQDALDYLTNKGYDPVFGARPLKRVIQQEVLNKLSREILAGTVNDGDRITLDYFEETGLVFRPVE